MLYIISMDYFFWVVCMVFVAAKLNLTFSIFSIWTLYKWKQFPSLTELKQGKGGTGGIVQDIQFLPQVYMSPTIVHFKQQSQFQTRVLKYERGKGAQILKYLMKQVSNIFLNNAGVGFSDGMLKLTRIFISLWTGYETKIYCLSFDIKVLQKSELVTHLIEDLIYLHQYVMF